MSDDKKESSIVIVSEADFEKAVKRAQEEVSARNQSGDIKLIPDYLVEILPPDSEQQRQTKQAFAQQGEGMFSRTGGAQPVNTSGTSSDFAKRVGGFGLTTANIFYHRPDYPAVLQSYLWQKHDLAPHLPELHKFLGFWQRELNAAIHSIVVAHACLVRPSEFTVANGGEFRLN